MVTRSFLAGFVMLVLALGGTRVWLDVAEATPQEQTAQPQPASMQDMMKMHEQMMGEMKAGHAKLDALVKEMNAATGDAKVNAVAAVVNELVRQHKAMHGRMEQMHQHMMAMGGMKMRR